MKQVNRLLLLLVCLLCASSVQARSPVVAIIIDDLGYRLQQDRLALSLTGPLAFAVLPHSPGALQVISIARRRGLELMLHLPMESSDRDGIEAPGTLKRSMNWITFVRTLQANLAAVPGIVAVNNHEGSILTADYQRMQWLMVELARHRGIAFIDSRTTHHTVALKAARETGLDATRRDVFLDHEPGKIAQQFEELISKAKQQGSALAIAHPHEETIRFLQDNLGRLKQQGIELVPVSEFIKIRQLANQQEESDRGNSISSYSPGL
jgi:polysaccharide deacetylase 2 family uncharacterized protein YibQ